MTSVILSPAGTMARSAAAAGPYALAAMAVLGFVGWMVRSGSRSQAADGKRAAFLRSLASSTEHVSPALYAAYVADPDWRGTALKAIVDENLDLAVRLAIRAALAAA